MSKKQILIVDDDQDVRLALHVRLKANGYETQLATDAVEAIAEARKSPPDLIILDLGLPAGDGFTVMERLQVNPYWACIPVIVVSARDAKTNRERSIKAGARAYFQKPVNNTVLFDAIHRLLGDEVANTSELWKMQ
jgi:two-component system KDP operon response regulator KdpE